ncbi:MAG: DNA polymerase I [Synergistaceae bacterium]|jgi:DNA polymerase-1|nr:DNA polymerase I [Synergistaceae bacterium]
MDETAPEPKKTKNYLLVDGHGLAFRGFYALPGMNAPDGTPTNAVLGFFNMLLKAVDEWRPDGIGLFFDPKGPTARGAMYREYKEGRKPAPDEFKTQMPIILELADVLGFPVFIRDGTEADDVIASTALALEKEGHEALIFSADKDMFQILRGGIEMARPSKGVSEFKLYDEAAFREEYGFEPAAMADYLALAGDSVDNIPGVKGIGDKTARALVSSYGSLDAIYEALGSLSESVRKKLENGRDAAYMSRGLVVPLPVEAADSGSMTMRPARETEARALLTRLGMKKLSERFNLAGDVIPEISVSCPPRENAVAEGTKEAEWSEILSRDRLVLTHNPDRLTARDGKWKLVPADAGRLKEWLERPDSELILSDYGESCARFDFLAKYGDKIRDTVLADYFYHPDAGSHPALDNAGEIWGAWETFRGGRFGDDMVKVMKKIDAPLVPVLSELGRRGLYADTGALRRLDAELASKIARIETEIYEASGGVINLNSPKQVGRLLFERLGLPAAKKTKTGYSTDVSVLEELSGLPEPMCAIPLKLLEYRECSKMSSGFVQPFIKHASSSRDGRIHSTFLHTATGTARLASRDPNVQNLPVFGEWAEKFRRAITPKDADSVFIAADYSQIELRVLACLSGEERLADAFRNGRDIHLETASWVFGLGPEEITPEQRRFAKTVNFGLIYGMGAHGLASRMGIPRRQAAAIVERYFEALPKVKIYLEKSAKDAKAAGYTRSIFGRIRPLAEVTTVEGRGSGSMDRVAVNTPIQSAAADIAKIALIRLDAALTEKFPDTKLVLQVHDSLICETPASRADEMERMLVDVMESVDCVGVPLKAEPKRGKSLAEV